MASSYSSDLKLELMATGENAGTWGTKTNTNLNLVQQAVAGYQAIDVASSDVALAMSDATISNARNATLKFTGTLAANRTVTIPNSIEKVYNIVDGTNHANYTLTFKTVSGTTSRKKLSEVADILLVNCVFREGVIVVVSPLASADRRTSPSTWGLPSAET